jgi:5-methylcytosine-specific restriction endonuclease McrA
VDTCAGYAASGLIFSARAGCEILRVEVAAILSNGSIERFPMEPARWLPRRYPRQSCEENAKGSGTCVYCGKVGPTTDDHIPPKCLFPPPIRHTLPKVPSCWTCNGGSSKDDEYFRLRIIARHDVGDHRGFGRSGCS